MAGTASTSDRTLQGIVSGERWRSHEEVADRSARAARVFDAAGVGAGDAVVLMLRNDFVFIEASFAAGTLGAYAVPMNWHYKGDEVAHVLTDSGAKVLVVHADLLPQTVGAVPPGVTVLVATTPPEVVQAYGIAGADAAVPSGASDWDAMLDAAEPWTEARRPSPAAMIYTSGTTGKPKGVRRLAAPKGGSNTGFYARIGMGPGVRTVITGPMYHTAPNNFGMGAAALKGLVVLQPRFDPEETLALVERYALDLVHMVPTMFVRMLRLPEETLRAFDLSSLRSVVHAAAPCPVDVKRQMIAWLGPIVYEYYGGTESGAVVACDSEEWLAHAGTVGTALPDCEIRIYDDAGNVLGPGQVGDVYMINRQMPQFTYQHRADERAAIERDGLITCGDVGELDADGFLYLRDRKRDMIISGGVNIYPIEIEACLLNHAAVRDCAVFGIPDDEFGEAIAAAVELDPAVSPPPSADDLRAHVRATLAGYKVPKVVDFHAALPREDSGKIFKRILRAPYWPEGRSI